MNPAGKPRRAASGVRKTAGVPQARLFERLGLHTPADFVTHLPLRYEDETRITPIGDARPGEHALFEGEIVDSEIRFGPRRTLQATLADDSGRLGLRWLHVYPGQQARLHAGRRVRARGEVRAGFHGLEIVHPLITEPGTPLPDALTPVYPTTQGLPQAALRKAIARALDEADLRDTLPAEVRQAYGLADFEPSLRLLHRPGPDISLELLAEHRHPAWRRIKFDELLAQQLALADARAARRAQAARSLRGNGSLTGRLLAALPFEPTGAQLRAVAQIGEDLARTHPMHRLLQGDVGSGKTLVAALAAAQAIEAGAQVAVMAPTEILAEQLWRKLSEWLQPLGVTAVWLTGGLPAAERRRALQAMASGEARLAVGTQALIQDKVEFESLGLVISDEQHRFGVGQRLALNRKGDQAKYRPHQLSMSATPIPRTLAMAFFADMDVSVLDELPPGRVPVRTRLFDDRRRDEVLARVGEVVRAGRQAYWVCPLVEESEALQLQTAVDTHELLRAALPDLRVGLMHGRLPAQEKAAVMDAFRAGDIDLLVATTVIEVGVDVPNAGLMVIEHAERFGLAQLHQLRGRVGRGGGEATCVLLYQPPLSAVARERLRAMYETTDGFEIARRDLAQRGPGELLGLRQSGQALLRFADLESDEDLLEQAREAAARLSADFPEHARAHRQRWMAGADQYLRS
ncbi:ATP-dependent DNA helicase RecG [Castellaniella daejeonensis]|uniref:ATP-dependent DNA helicase RecG n=1 Tax=Castellaniella daejeonensis TaxID=659013 RepID=A0ABP3D973_9BURK|nr:ATP-dependent DNA helicase RecG [Castellaniella sp.]HET8703799.1 ATP-dependent DNA helicase RecG [Castellaniella sp.]